LVAVSELIAMDLESPLREVDIQQSIALSESIGAALYDYLLTFEPDAEPIAVTESITIELEFPAFTEKSESIAVSEFVAAQIILNPGASEFAVVTENINIALDIPTNWVALANQGLASEIYYFTLTGDADATTDIEIPIGSFQARKRTGESTYLSVVIPDYATYAAAIAARSNGEMIIEMAYQYDGEMSIRQEILRAELEKINLYDGPLSRSINLVGHKTQTFNNRSVTLENAIYKSTVDAKRTFRFAKCDPYLNPGDTMVVGEDSMTVDYIVYMFSDNYKTMEVKE
jgi:hypothetical protein